MQVNPRQYDQRRAYLIGFADGMNMDKILNMDKHLNAVKKGLIEWGFQEQEVRTIESENEMPDLAGKEFNEIQSHACVTTDINTASKRSLVFLYYKGHGTVRSGCIHAVSELSENLALEGFLRNFENSPNVDALGLFDCCRRDKGQVANVYGQSDKQNFACVYRDPRQTLPIVQQMNGSNACICRAEDLQRPVMMAESFFSHLQDQRFARVDKTTIFQADLLSYNNVDEDRLSIVGWKQEENNQISTTSAPGLLRKPSRAAIFIQSVKDRAKSSNLNKMKQKLDNEIIPDKEFYEQKRSIFLRMLKNRTGKVFVYSLLMRFTFTLFFNKLNVVKAIQGGKPSLLIAVGCGAYNIIYHFVRRQFALNRQTATDEQKLSIWMSQEFEIFVACALASFGLQIGPENDIRIFKMLLFSRAITSFVQYFGNSSGLYKPVERKEKRHLTIEYFLSTVASYFLIYCLIFQPNSVGPSLMRTLNRAMGLNDGEMRYFDMLRGIVDMQDMIKASRIAARV